MNVIKDEGDASSKDVTLSYADDDQVVKAEETARADFDLEDPCALSCFKTEVKDEVMIEEHEVPLLSVPRDDDSSSTIKTSGEQEQWNGNETSVPREISNSSPRSDRGESTSVDTPVVDQFAKVERRLSLGKEDQLKSEDSNEHGTQISAREDDQFTCDVCNKCFHYNTLITHTGVLIGGKPFKRSVCNSCFTLRLDVDSHCRNDIGDKPFRCEVCDKRFSQLCNFKRHYRTIHSEQKRFKCEICSKCYSIRKSLVDHVRSHTGEKPFKCEVCNKRLSQRKNLVNHARTHTGEKPFRCDVCGKRFAQRNNLKSHERIHTGDKPFQCTICNKCFAERSILNKHCRIHISDKHLKPTAS